MTKEESVAKAIFEASDANVAFGDVHDLGKATFARMSRAAIAAADKWDAEQRAETCRHPRAHGDASTGPNAATRWSCPDCGKSYERRNAAGDWAL
jgi:hypothetical protein